MDQPTSHYCLAIECSMRQSRIALGEGEAIIAEMPVTRTRRHGVELTATIDRLLDSHNAKPGDLAEVYLSLGPGSFTGLRIGAATAKMLALAGGVRIVGLPSLDLLAAQHPQSIVCLNTKRDSAYCTGPGLPPGIRSISEIRETGLPIVGEKIEGASPARIEMATLYRLGRERAAAGRFDDPETLSPLYVREPEAVTLWREKT